MRLRVQKPASLIGRVEAVQQQIAERAYELFNLRGCALGRAVDDADYQNGLLRLWAPAAVEEIRTVDVR